MVEVLEDGTHTEHKDVVSSTIAGCFTAQIYDLRTKVALDCQTVDNPKGKDFAYSVPSIVISRCNENIRKRLEILSKRSKHT